MTRTIPDPALTRSLTRKARSLGADLVGVTTPGAMKKYPGQFQWISRILPGTRSILVLGTRIPAAALEAAPENPRVAQYSTQALYAELERIGFLLTLFLDDLGYRAAAIPTHLPVPMDRESKGLRAEISHRHTALEAGLGTIGLNGSLLTPEFGPRIRLISILTDAPLVPGKRRKTRHCTDCYRCLFACPAEAISPDGTVNVFSCARNHLRLGLPGISRFAEKLKTADPKTAKGLIHSPEFWEYWQNLTTGNFYSCFECLRVCPIGKKRNRRRVPDRPQ